MSRTKKNEAMSAEDLKRKMYSSLQSAGVLNDLRGYLRQSVINELRERYEKKGELPDDSGADLFIGSMKRNDNPSWEQKTMDNLVYQHLKQSHYLYTLSIFQQESGISMYEENLTDDLLRRFGASSDILDENRKNKENEESFRAPNSSSTPVADGNDKKLILWKILSRMSSPLHIMTKRDQMSFKEEKEKGRQMSLAEKLQAIDDEMDGTLRQRRYDDIEQRKSIVSLTNMTRKAEEEAEKRARDTFEQWKKVELASMRVKEQEKAREKILETTRRLEDDFAQRREALINREKNAIERLNNQKDSMEKDLHHQRQTLLQELQHIQLREKSLQERERILKEMEMIKIRELDLIKAEALSEQLRSGGVQGSSKTRHDSIVSSCAESLRKSLTGKESQQLDEVLKELDIRAKESEMLKGELEALRNELEGSKIQRPADLTKSSKHQSSRDLDDRSLRQRLDAVTRQLDEWSSQNKAQKEAVFHEEMDRWRREMMKLLEVKSQFEQKQQQLDDMMERVSSRVGSTARTPRKGGHLSGQLSSRSLRLLMDPQYDVTKQASIRDYEPVHIERNVRWADKMPYSVNSNLLGGNARSPRNLHNATSNTTTDLDSSNDTTSSVDLSTSGIRRDIRQKFRNLEKETEQLDQMYKKYINANYKDTSSKPPGNTVPSVLHSYDITKQKYDVTKPKTASIDEITLSSPQPIVSNVARSSVGSPSFSQKHGCDQEVLHVAALDQGSLKSESVNRDASSIQREVVPPLELESLPTQPNADITDTTSHKIFESQKTTDAWSRGSDAAPPSGNLSSFKSDGDHSSVSEPIIEPALLPMGHKSLPPPKVGTLPPLSPKERTLPPLQTHKGKNPALSVSDLLIGPENRDFIPEKLEDSDSSSGDSGRRYAAPSPFGRPALLERKKEEMLSSKSLEHEGKSPSRSTDFEENDGFEEILQNIDLRSSRSLEGDMDPKLTDLLNKLEPVPSSAKATTPNQGSVTSPVRSTNHEQDIVTSPSKTNQPEQVTEIERRSESPSESSFSMKNAGKSDSKVATKDDEYSDEFASSASEVKTMSDIERSSTSIPRIEEKMAGSDSDEDRSGADINWSNFQPNKSGDLLSMEPTAKEGREVQDMDFEKSVSDQSLEAPSDGGKKENSDDGFW